MSCETGRLTRFGWVVISWNCLVWIIVRCKNNKTRQVCSNMRINVPPVISTLRGGVEEGRAHVWTDYPHKRLASSLVCVLTQLIIKKAGTCSGTCSGVLVGLRILACTSDMCSRTKPVRRTLTCAVTRGPTLVLICVLQCISTLVLPSNLQLVPTHVLT